MPVAESQNRSWNEKASMKLFVMYKCITEQYMNKPLREPLFREHSPNVTSFIFANILYIR